MRRSTPVLLTIIFALLILTCLLLSAVASAQGYPPPWGPPAYLTYRLQTMPRPQYYGGYPGYRFYDAPISQGLMPRWSDPRAQWPRDYRSRRECWFRAEC